MAQTAVAPTVDETHAWLLDFAERQARPGTVGVTADATGRRRPRLTFVGGSDHSLGTRPYLLLADLPWPHRRTHSGAVWPRLAAALQATVGVQRFEPRGAYNPHRAMPSPRCCFPTEAFLLTPSGTWYVDPARHALRSVGHLPDAAPAEAVEQYGGGVVVFMAYLPSLPPAYVELRWALSLMEGGHAVSLVAEVAAALGLTPRVRLDLAPYVLTGLAMAHAESTDNWVPLAVVELGDVRAEAVRPWADYAVPRQSVIGVGEAPTDEADPVVRADRLTWGPMPPGSNDDVGPARSDPRPATGDPTGSGLTWAQILFARNAGRGNKGFTPSPERLPRRALLDALRAVRKRPDWIPASIWREVRLLAAVERVDDLADGLYECPADDADAQPNLVAPGRLMAGVQAAWGYPAVAMNVQGCNAALLLVVDNARILRDGSGWALRSVQLALGAMFQAGGLALTPYGAFLRPTRSYDTDRLFDPMRLVPGETVAYLGLVGRSRFADLLLDVRR